MEKRKIFLVFAIVMIAVIIAFTACSAAENRRLQTPTPYELGIRPVDTTHELELEQNSTMTIELTPRAIERTVQQITTPRKIPICIKQDKKELRPLGIVDDVMYLGMNNDGEIVFASTWAKNCVVGLQYIQGQNYYLSTSTVLKNVIVEETTEILYYN